MFHIPIVGGYYRACFRLNSRADLHQAIRACGTQDTGRQHLDWCSALWVAASDQSMPDLNDRREEWIALWAFMLAHPATGAGLHPEF